MNIKYIGMDVHKETISIAVMNGEGKVVMESVIESRKLQSHRSQLLGCPLRDRKT
jgi:hypothetical protein